MANSIGSTLKNAALDVTRRIQRAGEAILNPTKLGGEALGAFKTLRVLDNLASLLPPQMQGIAKALLGVGISNIGQHGDPTAKEAARGYASALAIKSGRVPAEVLAKATTPEQRQALTDAAASGDLAAVKSILRHNKKEAAKPTQTAAKTPVPTPTVDASAVASLQERADKGELAARLANASSRAATGEVHVAFKDGEKVDIASNHKGNRIEGKRNGKRMSKADLEETMRDLRDAGLKNGDAIGLAIAARLGEIKKFAKVPLDAADTDAIEKDRKHMDGLKRGNQLAMPDGSRFEFDISKKPLEATKVGADGKETTLKGKQLRSVANAIDQRIADLRKEGKLAAMPADLLETMKAASAAFKGAV